MADHWKSTPSYWCKFCSQYVRDTPIERKNHEATGRHQGNIQRSLRELHKNKAREDRDKQRAKDEVARLNALVSGEKKGSGSGAGPAPKPAPSAPAPAVRSAAADRKARAEQLLAMGVKLPEELEREVTGVGGWQTVSERVIQPKEDTSLAGIMKKEEESKEGVLNKGVHKRKADEDEDGEGAAQVGSKRKVWGSSLKTYPGTSQGDDEDGEDLDALLSGVGTKEKVQEEGNSNAGEQVKEEAGTEEVKGEGDVQKPLADVPPPVVFKKKRKVKA